MTKVDKIITDFTEGDIVKVIVGNNKYINKTGTVVRFGAAGETVKYIFVVLDDVLTTMMFMPFQLKKVE